MDLKKSVQLPKSPVPSAFLDEAETLCGALEELARRFPDYECLTILDRGGERRVSLGTIWDGARRFQSVLAGRGLDPGRVVVIILPTGPELVSAYFGAMLTGGIPALLAPPSNRLVGQPAYLGHLGTILRNAEPGAIYCESSVAEVLRGAGAEWGTGAVVTPGDVAGGRPAGATETVTAEDIATVQYSSGSTGIPKGILLTHRAMLNNIRAVRDGLGLVPDDVSVNWIPLYHDMGLIDAFLLPLFSGCHVVLIPTMDFMRDPALWLWAIHHYRGVLSWAPNFAYAICAKRVADDLLAGLNLSCWRIAINAAEPVLASTIDAFTGRFAAYGFKPEAMTPAWGLAENVTIATAHPIGEQPLVESIDRQAVATLGVACPSEGDGMVSVAIGRCLPHCEVEIRDDGGRTLPDRELGAIWLRTNSLFSAYHRSPELTAQVLVGGWLNTGDRGYIADGQLFFVSREKDLLVVRGAKYAPHDVERVINGVPGVREGCAVVFGILNEERGTEDVAAVVETRESNDKELAALRNAIRREVTRQTGLVLRYVVLVPPGGVQKTTSGKLARAATRARYAAQLV